MTLESVIRLWQSDPATRPNFVVWRTLDPREAQVLPLPADLDPRLKDALHQAGIDALYSHQAAAWQLVRNRKNVVLATSTASGKTLAYNLPVLQVLLEDAEARALYLFPTKALAQDQLVILEKHLLDIGDVGQAGGIRAAIYDGDTPAAQRAAIRRSARIVLSNPDMLHTGMLPHHTVWADLFQHLRFVVIDEVHTYRGVFGSHVANVIRRLLRVARFYGSQPQFILSSATIGNPAELAAHLIECPVELIDSDGSARGPRYFLLYNPPVVDSALGLRKSSLLEGVRLGQDLLAHHVQAVVFARSRRSVEQILTYMHGSTPQQAADRGASYDGASVGGSSQPVIRGYRSGYLPSERRAIEKGIRDGSISAVVATNALELGIDIGGLGAAVLVGYPGTIASVYQQAGRAGRGSAPGIAVLIASASPLDQFLMHHPDYFFGQSPERALIAPDHLLVLLNHLRCAMFELPFAEGESFGAVPAGKIREYLDFLVAGREAHASEGKYFWMADSYPAAGISLRSASADSVILQTTGEERPVAVGEVDVPSALWMVHPKAVYIHDAQQYYVQELDLEKHVATLIPVSLDYYTEPQRQTELRVVTENARQEVPAGEKGWGEVQVTTQVIGFKKLTWSTRENLGVEPLDLPATDLQTTAYWVTLGAAALEDLRNAGAWTNDPNDYGPDWPEISLAVRKRDGFRCQVCGAPERGREYHVHHKIPFRAFTSAAQANRLENLVTLCPADHRRAEQNVRIRSGLAGVSYVLSHLAPLFLMCDQGDLGEHTDAAGAFRAALPSVVLYDQVPAGIGFSQQLYDLHSELVKRALELVTECECQDGCPSCVGPGGENGAGGKAASLAILRALAS